MAGRIVQTIADVSDSGGGTVADFSGTFGLLDPTVLPNGPYRLRLLAEDFSGNVVSTEKVVHVDGNLKLGNFTLSFTDITVPVAGIPITVTRSYDTLRAGEMGDFGYGYGWRMDMGYLGTVLVR